MEATIYLIVQGVRLMVECVNDAEPNAGGLWCMVYRGYPEEISDDYEDDYCEDFCIHPEDCDCNDEDAITAYCQNYLENIAW